MFWKTNFLVWPFSWHQEVLFKWLSSSINWSQWKRFILKKTCATNHKPVMFIYIRKHCTTQQRLPQMKKKEL